MIDKCNGKLVVYAIDRTPQITRPQRSDVVINWSDLANMMREQLLYNEIGMLLNKMIIDTNDPEFTTMLGSVVDRHRVADVLSERESC